MDKFFRAFTTTKAAWVLLGLLSCFPGSGIICCQASTREGQTTAVISQTQTDADLMETLIGPGDLIEVRVYDPAELSSTYRVSGAGDVDLFLLGKVHVAGMTPRQLAGEIVTRLRDDKLVVKPDVTVQIREFATQGVTVLGEVAHPGVYPMLRPRTLVQILAMAGGLTPAADTRITIHRAGDAEPVTIPVKFDANDPRSALAKTIFPGDQLIVPRSGIVYVLGEVTRPGGLLMRDNGSITVVEALAESGGLTHAGAWKRAFIMRKTGSGYERDPTPLGNILHGQRDDIELKAGDALIIPLSGTKFFFETSAGLLGGIASAALYATAR